LLILLEDVRAFSLGIEAHWVFETDIEVHRSISRFDRTAQWHLLVIGAHSSDTDDATE